MNLLAKSTWLSVGIALSCLMFAAAPSDAVVIDCRKPLDAEVESLSKDLAILLLAQQIGFPSELKKAVQALREKPNGEDLVGQLGIKLYCYDPLDVTLVMKNGKTMATAEYIDVQTIIDEWRVKIGQAIIDLHLGIQSGTVPDKIKAIIQALRELPVEDRDAWVANFNRSVERINHYAGKPSLPFIARRNAAGEVEVAPQ